MTYIRRLILAFALIAGIFPAIAQVPPPVPALPDSERRTSYSISASTCACAVNFALYGDSTDYANWLEVFVNGVLVPASSNWTITSPSGSLATLPRPITDAVLTFTAAQTGTVQIVGARRPRRTSQFSETSGVPARNINQVVTDITATLREMWDKTNDVTGRAVLGLPGESIGLMPSAATRAGKFLVFDGNGNPAVTSATLGAGNITGVGPTVVGHVAAWNNTAATAIGDSGYFPVQPTTCATHLYMNTIASSGVPGCAQPQISDLQNIGANTVLGNPTNATGAVQAFTLPTYNVTSFGAVCDNTTDDRLAIIAALAAIPSGATLVFPSTKCAVKSLTAGGANPHIFVLTKPVHLSLPNCGGISKSGVIGILFDVQTDGVTIDGSPCAVIDGGWAATTYSAFDLAIATNNYDQTATQRNYITIKDVQFTNWAMGAMFLFYCNSCTIDKTIVNNVAYAAIFAGGMTNSQITGNKIQNVWSSTGPDQPGNPVYRANHYGIAVSTNLAVSVPSVNVVVANNIVQNVPAWECYDTHSGQNITFSNNIGIGCNAGIAISSPSPLVATDITITGNKITCIPLGSPVYSGSTGQSVGGPGISVVGLSSGSPGARATIANNIIHGCGVDNVALEGAVGTIYVALWVGFTVQSNTIYSPIYRAMLFGDFTRGNVMGNFVENLTSGPAGSNAVIETTGANTTINFGENTADGSGYNGYSIDVAAGAGFSIGISRSNIFNGVGTLYVGGTSVNRTDLGATAP